MGSDVAKRDGSIDFSSGVNSIATTTVAGEGNPNGLPRTALAWVLNCSLRDGGISPRSGWLYRATIQDNTGLFQGTTIYAPFGANPYSIWAISGHILKVDLETYAITDLSVLFNEYMPADQTYFFFCQAEQFLIIQAGDGVTLPLFWDGATLRRSKGINTSPIAPGTPGVNEIPAATAMCYYMGRLWYAQDRTVSAGDIVGANSGTAAYDFRDAVLNVTENPLVVGGDGFTVPSNDGTVIRGIAYSASIDAALGQGRLFIGTRKAIYSLQVPVTRTDWIAATSANQPLMTVVQLANGWVNDRSITPVNGDLFYQSLEPGIRSLQQSVRNFQQWGMVDLSANEQRILQFADRSLLRFSSGIFFENRLLQTTLPRQTSQGVVHDQIIPLDMVPISSFNQQREPNWEGSYQAMPAFQMIMADFGGRERAFAAVRSEIDQSIQLYEITRESRVDYATDPETDGNRIVFQFETPAFNWSNSIGALELKKLVSAELWVDRLFSTVNFEVEYRPDSATCWIPWSSWKECSAQNTLETVELPIGYPVDLGPCYRATMHLPAPDPACAPCNAARPANICYQVQARITIRGYCRVRGWWIWGQRVESGLYSPQLIC